MLPFDEIIYADCSVRTFSEKVDSGELMWHRDREDRTVTVIGETDWLFQMDDCLPVKLDEVFIPAGVYHRIIKGSGDLTVRVVKHK